MRATIDFGSVRSLSRYLCCVAAIMAYAALLGVTPVAHAASDPPAQVGRIGYIEGEVAFFADSNDGWRGARLNYPVTSKNSIRTGGGGRAEVRVGAAALRLDARSTLDFTRIDDASLHVLLPRGTLSVRLRTYPADPDRNHKEQDSVTVETNEGTIFLQADGRYRFDAAEDRNETRVSVLAGLARFDNRGATLNVEAGQSLTIRRTNGAASFVFDSAGSTPFDQWAMARDSRWDETHQRHANARLLSPRMTGYEDLDAFGDWIDDREYGRLWSPRAVVSGWAPYRHGSWAYVRPWGWTWVDEAAWGFAPFHYGRWLHRHTRWYWWPGSYQRRPVYAPALVGWQGGGNWQVSLTLGGNIGWFPLAPHEHYVPHYTHNHHYIRQINNITNHIIVNPPTRFVNQHHGRTVVGNTVVVNGEPVWRTANPANPSHVHARLTKPTLDPHEVNRTSPTHLPPNLIPAQSARPHVVRTPSGVTTEAPVMSVGGEAARVRPGAGQGNTTVPHTPEAMPGSPGTPGANHMPPMARPSKPNPVVVRGDAPQTQLPVIVQGAPASAPPAARPQRPQSVAGERANGNEQRVDGPVRLKEQGERGNRGTRDERAQKNPDAAKPEATPGGTKPHAAEKPSNGDRGSGRGGENTARSAHQ